MTKTERANLPQPHQSYERADPNAESGMGDLDKAKSTPVNRPDGHQQANENRPGGKDPAPELPANAAPTDPESTDNTSIDEVEVGTGQGLQPTPDVADGKVAFGPPRDASHDPELIGDDGQPIDPTTTLPEQPVGKKPTAKDAAHRHDDKV
ncbi:MAG TPA: hypothetical protein PLD59_16310 [Tepidisphaeraceae bacterium]|nr:hypothetical protein [Tepidisphaeraceae bacterium]